MRVRSTGWDDHSALVNGKYDVIMAGMSVTEEKTISFSKAYDRAS